MATRIFNNAKRSKADEFYTQLADIEREMEAYLEFNPNLFKNKAVLCPCDNPYESNFFRYFAQNFDRLGLKKLTATCYSGSRSAHVQPLSANEAYHPNQTAAALKIEIAEARNRTGGGHAGAADIEWLLSSGKNSLARLEGDGDFRSDEVRALRDEADFVITNPPFSLFRDFLAWIMEAGKRFLVISNMNALTYKEVFPHIKDNRIWMGMGFGRSFRGFLVPRSYPLNGSEARVDEQGNRIVSTNNTIWLTNIDHGRRHLPLKLVTMAENLKSSKHRKMSGKSGYDRYDNCDAIEVPYTDSIPSDYTGAMGVPISFLHKYCPEQFEIIKFRKGDDGRDLSVGGKCPYFRILIRHKAQRRSAE